MAQPQVPLPRWHSAHMGALSSRGQSRGRAEEGWDPSSKPSLLGWGTLPTAGHVVPVALPSQEPEAVKWQQRSQGVGCCVLKRCAHGTHYRFFTEVGASLPLPLGRRFNYWQENEKMKSKAKKKTKPHTTWDKHKGTH